MTRQTMKTLRRWLPTVLLLRRFMPHGGSGSVECSRPFSRVHQVNGGKTHDIPVLQATGVDCAVTADGHRDGHCSRGSVGASAPKPAHPRSTPRADSGAAAHSNSDEGRLRLLGTPRLTRSGRLGWSPAP